MKKKKIVVLGFMCRMPIAGVVWQTLHYLVGLERLGFESYYAECHGHWIYNPVTPDSKYKSYVVVGEAMSAFGLSDRWFAWANSSKEESFGMPYAKLLKVYEEAEAIINISAYTPLDEDMLKCSRRVYLETDPGEPQIRLSQDDRSLKNLLDAHTHYFTFGENLGSADCLLPVPEYPYQPTRQPVLTDVWDTELAAFGESFTTIGKWAQGKKYSYGNETYYWSKHLEFLKFIELPQRTNQPFELCFNLSKLKDEDANVLRKNGWHLTDALSISSSLQSYQKYIQRSRGEFTVAKDLNIRLRSGWFSDRSACYLAAGKPVITQDTAFGNLLPTGKGLFAFRTIEDILAAVDSINADYAGNCRAAKEIAAEYFDSNRVLTDLLRVIGL